MPAQCPTAIADRHGLTVVEDACQAHGAEYRGRRAGSFGYGGQVHYFAAGCGAVGDMVRFEEACGNARLDSEVDVLREVAGRRSDP